MLLVVETGVLVRVEVEELVLLDDDRSQRERNEQ
jgi:hypothetical protein